MKYLNKEIKETLKSRLNSQRRYFNFDGNYILVLPFLEHMLIDNAVEKIKFFINTQADFVKCNQIEFLCLRDNKLLVKLKNGDSHYLHYRKLDGLFMEVKFNKFSLENLSIDHVPSIYVVLYSHYLKKSKTFNVLTNFSKSLSIDHWDTKIIKAKGFRDQVEKILDDSMEKDAIYEAYRNLFQDISLEITIGENNNANLSLKSLEYFKQNN